VKLIQTDILVVGSGGAGLMALISAAKSGANAALVTKGKVLRCGATVMAPGALAAVDDRWKKADDSKALHETDTYIGGDWLNNQELVRQTVEDIGDILMELEEMGCMFHRTEDGSSLALRIEGGHTYHRSPYMENRIGHELLKGLWSETQKRHLPIYEEIMITGLDVQNGKIAGAVGFHTVTQEVWQFSAKAVILATGGAGELYELTDNSNDLTGDGYALSYQAGAQLMDMEFVQTYPIGFLAPAQLRGVLGCYPFIAHLYNSENERFMESYDPRLEMTTRNRLSQAIMIEVLEGRGSPLGGVYCDLTYLEPGYLEKELPALYNNYHSVGLDPYTQRFEIAPTYHFFMGGARVDKDWQTRVQGLYSVGEAAAGVHGSNRVGQNALTEMLVSGRVAGRHSAAAVAQTDAIPVNAALAQQLEVDLTALRTAKEGMRPVKMRKILQHAMQQGACVLRTQKSLEETMAVIDQLANTPIVLSNKAQVNNREMTEAYEIKNLLLVARCVVTAAMERKETRGAQYRHDFPTTDWENWTGNILLEQQDGQLTSSFEPVQFVYQKREVK